MKRMGLENGKMFITLQCLVGWLFSTLVCYKIGLSDGF